MEKLNIMDFHNYMIKRGYMFEQIISSLSFTPVFCYLKGNLIIETFDYIINEDMTSEYFKQYIIYNNKGFVHYSGPATYVNIDEAEKESKSKIFRLRLLWRKVLTSVLGTTKKRKKVLIKPSSSLDLLQ